MIETDVLRVELERVRTALGSRPEERARRRLLVAREVEEQLSDLVAEVHFEQVARPRHAVLEALGPLVHQILDYRVQRLHLTNKQILNYMYYHSNLRKVDSAWLNGLFLPAGSLAAS